MHTQTYNIQIHCIANFLCIGEVLQEFVGQVNSWSVREGEERETEGLEWWGCKEGGEGRGGDRQKDSAGPSQ